MCIGLIAVTVQLYGVHKVEKVVGVIEIMT